MSDVHTSIISKVEMTWDIPGWMVYFDNNQGYERIPDKYNVRPRVGDEITLYGYPFTRGIGINNEVVFMNSVQDTSGYFDFMQTCVSAIRDFEQAIDGLKRQKVS